MATFQHAESRRLYSWWWDSHIPKNSKWLQENLTDMDDKIGSMIKLIEEDADSFAQRAEMFYKKRPELMKLVEEFYRAYRALAERYDHATGVLHQARQKMAEAFPNEMPLAFSDEPPSSGNMAEPHSAKMEPISGFFDPGGPQGDDFSVSSLLSDSIGDGDYSERSDALESKTGVKLLSEMITAAEGKASDYRILKKEISRLSKENEDLKSLISSESARADKAEIEVQRLVEKLSKSKSEKEHALLQYQQSLEKICNLKNEISCAQEDLKKVNDEMLMGVKNLKSAEERCSLLGKGNQSLRLEVDRLRQKTRDLEQELNMKQGELTKLNISLQDEQLRIFQAETALLSMEKLYNGSQEEVKRLTLELQIVTEKLKDLQLSKAGLEQEVQKFKAESDPLNEEKLSSALKTINLQQEIISLKDAERKLKDEVGLHVEEKKVLQQELYRLKEDRHDIEKRHHELTEQIQAVDVNVESLQALIKELRDGNVELKETIKKYEDEKLRQLENQKHIDDISENNVVLENALSVANFELEGLQGKIKELEDSCEYLRGKISIHHSEKAMLVSQVDAIAQNMGKLSERNIFLDNSLCDVHVELEDLRGKLKGLEECCQFLHDQNSDLLAEKSTLVSQVENIRQSLENMESRFADLECKHSNLEQEKDLTLHQVAELQELLRQEKEVQKTLNECTKNELSTLENQICLLREEGRLWEEELDMEQHKIISAQIEIFILQQCLCDMKENILILSEECQKHQETSNSAKKVISEVKEQNIIQEKMIKSLSEHNEKLREGMHQIFRVTNITKDYGSLDGIKDEVLLQLILHDVRHLLCLVSDSRDEKQNLLLEKSVVVTLLEQIGLQTADLRSEKIALEQESKSRGEELSLLQREKHELLEMNEQLKQDLQVGNQREKILKEEMEILSRRFSDLEEVHKTLQRENSAAIQGKHSLSEKFYKLQEEKNKLEEENGALILEALSMEYLYFTISNSFTDRILNLHVLIRDRDNVHGVSNELDQKAILMGEEIEVLQLEKTHPKESFFNLEDCRVHLVAFEDDLTAERSALKQLNIQIGEQKNVSMQKDMKMARANPEFHHPQNISRKSSRDLEGLKLEMDGANMAREELHNNISTLSEVYANRENEIACLLQANEVLKGEIDKLQRAVDELRSKEEHCASELQKGIDEVRYCEEEIASLLEDIQFATTNAVLFQDKVLGMIKRRGSLKKSAMLPREVLNGEITLGNAYVKESKEKLIVLEGENRGLKADLKALLNHVVSLGDDIASLEAHTLSLTKHNASNDWEKQGKALVSLQHEENCPGSSNDHSIEATAGILKLQDLHAKVNALQNVVVDTRSLLEQERLGSEAARKEIEDLQSGVTDNEITKEKFELMMKDIQLDLVSNTSKFGNGTSSNRRKKRGNPETKKRGNAEASDQMLELWGAVEVDCSNQIQKSPLITVEHDFEFQQIEVEEEKGKNPSCELVAEKELGIDKQELTRKIHAESQKEWSRKVNERLSSDAQRLSALQASLQELKSNIETSEECNSAPIFEFDTAKAQLKDAEGAILQLIDTNSKLMQKAEDINSSSEKAVGEKSDSGSTSRRRLSERARRVSEKIGRLELELQKIQCILLKLEGQHVDKSTTTVERSSRTLLKDYIYGRREGRGQKKGSSCGCIRLKKKDN